MQRLWRHVLLMLVAVALAGLAPVIAQEATEFGDKLGELPVDRATNAMINGTGNVTATLNGNTLEVSGTFEGIDTPATAAHIHQGAPGMSGPPIFDLEVTNDTQGEVSGTIELSDEQIDLLRDRQMYVQIHSEQNPDGVLRAWLWPR